jgi:hypothetical protein
MHIDDPCCHTDTYASEVHSIIQNPNFTLLTMSKHTMEDRRLCYICEEDDSRPTFKVCLCDYRVHNICFRKIVTRVESHKERCPICLKTYTTFPVCHMKMCVRSIWILFLTVVWLATLYRLCVIEYPTLFSIIIFCGFLLWSITHICTVFEKTCVLKVRPASKQQV